MIQGCFVIGDSLQPKPPGASFTTPIAHLGDARNHYVPSKDGKRFLVLAESRENANAASQRRPELSHRLQPPT